MKKNAVQFQKGFSLPDFFKKYGTEEQCEKALFDWRWAMGFICPECNHTRHCVLNTNNLYQCYHCHHQTSLTSGTIFSDTKLPLTTWFLSMFLLTQTKNGIFALELKRLLGVIKGARLGYSAIVYSCPVVPVFILMAYPCTSCSGDTIANLVSLAMKTITLTCTGWTKR